MSSFTLARPLFCRGVGLCSALAFASLYVQWEGLFGVGGVTPLRTRSALLAQHSAMGLDLDSWANVVLLVGFCCSVSSVCAWCNRFTLGVAWLCYFSLYSVGEPFLSFQWDILLLETLVLAILWAPWGGFDFLFRDSVCSHSILWLTRFTLFKLMFMSGAVKIQARCPSWLGLTALDYHYATQCLPTPLAWYAHQLPPIFQQLCVAACLVIEIPVSTWCLIPIRTVRLPAAALQVLLQVSIILTGNYTFFNLLTIVLCTSLVDDKAFSWLLPFLRSPVVSRSPPQSPSQSPVIAPSSSRSLSRSTAESPMHSPRSPALEPPSGNVVQMFVNTLDRQPTISWLLLTIAVGFSPYTVISLLGVERNRNPGARWYEVQLSASVFDGTIGTALPFTLLLFTFLIAAVAASHSITLIYRASDFRTVKSTVRSILVGSDVMVTVLLACVVFCVSLSTFAPISSRLRERLPQLVWEARSFTEGYPISSGYGLFRRMTGMGPSQKDEDGHMTSVVARPELILLGFDGSTWHEIEFPYKPGRVDRSPPWVAPHQPRLDWQMWFAALSSEPPGWLVSLLDKLLRGSPPVIELLDPSYPFKDTPPQQIKIIKYDYDFTSTRTPSNHSSDWWRRSGGREYLFPIGKDNRQVATFLERQGWVLSTQDRCLAPIYETSPARAAVCRQLQQLHEVLYQFPHMMAVLFACLAVRGAYSMGASKKK